MKFKVPLAILSMFQPKTKQWFIFLLFSKIWLVKSIRIVLKYYLNIIWILFQIFLAHKNNSTSRIKDILNKLQLNELINGRFWKFAAKDPSSTKKYSLVNLVSIWRWVCFFSLHAVLFAMNYSSLLICCYCNWYFHINWSARNSLKTWRVTYL